MLAALRSALALAAFALTLAGPANAQSAGQPPPPLSTADLAAVHKIIQTQIDALKMEDYAAAYALEASAMKALYPNVQTFTALIKTRFSQLINPKSIVFGPVAQTSQGPVQRVFVTASDGRAWQANYSLQRQPDMTWLIAGFTVARDNDSSSL